MTVRGRYTPDTPDTSTIDDGTVDGQIPYWDTATETWKATSGITWDNANSLFKIPGLDAYRTIATGAEKQLLSTDTAFPVAVPIATGMPMGLLLALTYNIP